MIDQTPQILTMLNEGRNILVITHENPDGDAIGGLLGLTFALRERGKQVTAYSQDGSPKYLHGWLPGIDLIETEADPANYDVICALDCGEQNRMGRIAPQVLAQPRVINIDHHGTNEHFGTTNLVYPKASSTCELLVGLLQKGEYAFTKEVATNLYLGIYTDTGMFKNANSTPESYHAAGEMVAAGADFMNVAKRVYIDIAEGRLRLLARVLSTLQVDADGRIAGMVCTNDDLRDFGCTSDDLENFIEHPRAIIGVDVAYLLREMDNGKGTKGSMRSTQAVDVAKVSAVFGGGGHQRAAGFRTQGELHEVRAKLVAALKEELQRA